MKESNFTKGKWAVYPSNKHHGAYIESSGVTVCDLYFMRDGRVNKHPNSESNSHLIAAAPDHDEALCMINEKLPSLPNVLGGDYMITLTQNEVNQIRSSLAKARGQS